MIYDSGTTNSSAAVVVEPLVYFAFLFLMKTVITKTQGLVVAIAKREYINKSNKCIII